MNIAAKVAAAKKRWPEDFCPVKGCLWRVYTSRGVNPCRKHSGADERSVAVRVVGAVEETRRGDGVSVIAPTASSLPPSRLHNAGCLCKHCTMPLPF